MTSSHWLALIVCAGALLRIIPVWFGLPYRARPDEEVAVSIALRVLDGDLHPHFFHWPSLTFYFFAGVFGVVRTIAGVLSFDSLGQLHYFLIGRIVIAAAGTATIVVLHRLGRDVAGEGAGLTAAALLAVAMLHVRDSHFAMTDVLMTLLVTTSLALIARGLARAQSGALEWRSFAAAGLAGGLAASTKYNAAAVIAAMAAAQLVLLGRTWRAALHLHRWLPLLAYGVLFALGFLIGTPYAVLDAPAFWADLQYNFTHLSGGHAGIDLGRGWTSHLVRSLPFGLGPTTFAAALWGFVPLAARTPRHALVLGAFVVALYASVGSGETVFFRYILPIVPVLCLAAALAVLHLAGILAAHTRLPSRTALAVVLLVTVGPGLVNSIWFDALLARTDSRVLAGRWIEARLSPDDSLYDSGADYAALDLSRVPHHRWHFDAESRSFGHSEGRNPDWLVVHQSPISAYATAPPEVRLLASREYELVHTVRGVRTPARGAVYDLQDAFFMPVWGFWRVERPGPTVRIYRRKDLPAVGGAP